MAQEIWFRTDIGHILSSLDSVPVPSGDYAAGWRDALATLGLAIGIEQPRAPSVWIVPNERQIGAPGQVVDLVEVRR